MVRLTQELVLRAYAVGVFPMAESGDSDTIFWFDPELRGIIPLDGFHLPRRLRRVVKRGDFEVRIDTSFEAVISACGDTTPDRPSTWINGAVREAFCALHRHGHAHSVEAWRDGQLVGGLYGVALGAAFFGESMFSRVADASKVALVHLVARLRAGGFTLLDTQFVTAHLARFGAVEIPRAEYRRRLADAVARPARFHCGGEAALVSGLLQSSSQTS